jgi:hypothetical protein
MRLRQGRLLRNHEASRVGGVGADLAVNLDQPLVGDLGDLLAGHRILETVTEEDGEGKGFAELVGTRGGARSLVIRLHVSKERKSKRYIRRRT